ncbi:hypothetical protein ACHAXT_009040 [Thalassiosira profunda]
MDGREDRRAPGAGGAARATLAEETGRVRATPLEKKYGKDNSEQKRAVAAATIARLQAMRTKKREEANTAEPAAEVGRDGAADEHGQEPTSSIIGGAFSAEHQHQGAKGLQGEPGAMSERSGALPHPPAAGGPGEGAVTSHAITDTKNVERVAGEAPTAGAGTEGVRDPSVPAERGTNSGEEVGDEAMPPGTGKTDERPAQPSRETAQATAATPAIGQRAGDGVIDLTADDDSPATGPHDASPVAKPQDGECHSKLHLQERTSLDGDDDDCHAPNSAPQKGYTELVRETEQLLKDLPSRPSQDNFEEESAWSHLRRASAVGRMTTNRASLLADFTRCGEAEQIVVTPEDEAFLFQMMERDDITVISDGLAESIDPTIWTRKYIEGCIGNGYHHKFQRVDQQPNGQPKENEGMYSMKVADYFRYLDQRQSIKEAKSDGAQGKAERFTFVDSYGNKQSVNVDEVCLYMLDVDVPKLLPRALEDLQRNFHLPGILPGGSHCMMNAINAGGRPFMGPNLYITPPCSFTHFHQDGHGTVDSGHLCLSGYNEVVMLRRLTERHKCHALNLLTGTSEPHSTLYGLPHRDGLGTQPGWPSKAAIEKCKSMQYYPSVFVLKPGQLVHINKGRLHAFRKLAPVPLRPTDCHAHLRQEVLAELQNKGVKTEVICFSVAWDWMFKGVTSEGINREVSGILECARLNRIHDLQSLAIPETSLVFLAKENIAKHQQASNADESRALFSIGKSRHQTPTEASEPDAKTVLRGILPSLQYGDCGFVCKLCKEELSNVYMHCDGCEKLLNKDFNICSSCHREERYKVKVLMHPFNKKPHSIHNHTGNPQKDSQGPRCPCKNGKPCVHCDFCTGCSCRCHQRFTFHYRFMDLQAELDVLAQAESILGADVISQSNETKARLLSLR